MMHRLPSRKSLTPDEGRQPRIVKIFCAKAAGSLALRAVHNPLYQCLSETQNRFDPAPILGTSMLQSAIFADLQVNNFGIPTVRLAPRLPLATWAKDGLGLLSAMVRGSQPTANVQTLSDHLKRDIGLAD